MRREQRRALASPHTALTSLTLSVIAGLGQPSPFDAVQYFPEAVSQPDILECWLMLGLYGAAATIL
jgi:hypothetical protein